jgi:hypothetical protein
MSRTHRIRNRARLIAAGVPCIPREELGPVIERILSRKDRAEFFDRIHHYDCAPIVPPSTPRIAPFEDISSYCRSLSREEA